MIKVQCWNLDDCLHMTCPELVSIRSEQISPIETGCLSCKVSCKINGYFAIFWQKIKKKILRNTIWKPILKIKKTEIIYTAHFPSLFFFLKLDLKTQNLEFFRYLDSTFHPLLSKFITKNSLLKINLLSLFYSY